MFSLHRLLKLGYVVVLGTAILALAVPHEVRAQRAIQAPMASVMSSTPLVGGWMQAYNQAQMQIPLAGNPQAGSSMMGFSGFAMMGAGGGMGMGGGMGGMMGMGGGMMGMGGGMMGMGGMGGAMGMGGGMMGMGGMSMMGMGGMGGAMGMGGFAGKGMGGFNGKHAL